MLTYLTVTEHRPVSVLVKVVMNHQVPQSTGILWTNGSSVIFNVLNAINMVHLSIRATRPDNRGIIDYISLPSPSHTDCVHQTVPEFL